MSNLQKSTAGIADAPPITSLSELRSDRWSLLAHRACDATGWEFWDWTLDDASEVPWFSNAVHAYGLIIAVQRRDENGRLEQLAKWRKDIPDLAHAVRQIEVIEDRQGRRQKAAA